MVTNKFYLSKKYQHSRKNNTNWKEIFNESILKTKYFTHHNLQGVINNKNLVALKEGKDTIMVIMNKLDYVGNFLRMVKGM